MHASELWEGKGLGPTLARLALAPASWLYVIGWEVYLGVYRLGIKRAKHPHSPILCIGNLVSGGSGKTPVAIHVAQVLQSQGREVVISSSGYGSPRSEAATIAPEGELDAREWGDEAAQFRWLLPDVPLIVGRRRVLAAELCAKQFPNALLLMDDGFQHLPLKKDLSIILDPLQPRNRNCLPAGPYREGRWNRKRADLVLPSEFEVKEAPVKFSGPTGEPEELTSCCLLCALGQPQKVVASLEAAGVKVVQQVLLPDHDPLDAGTLLERLPTNLPIVVTGKDWVKLRNRPDWQQRRFVIVSHSVTIEPGDRFAEWLRDNLHG